MRDKDIIAYCSALGAAFFWGFSFVWFKIAYLAYKPLTVVFFRLIISAGIIWIIGSVLKRIQKPDKKDLGLFVIMAFFEPFIYFLGESYGLIYVSSTVASVIVATIPLLSPIAAWYFFKEKVQKRNIVGFIFSFLGVALVVMDGNFHLSASAKGVALEFIAVIGAIGYSIVLRKIVIKYNTITIIAYQNFIGIIFFLPLWILLDFNDFLSIAFNPKSFKAIILLAFFSSILAYVFFTQSIRKIGVNRSNAFVNLIPVFVAAQSYFVLNEKIYLQQIIGIVVVIVGLFLVRPTKRKIIKKNIDLHSV